MTAKPAPLSIAHTESSSGWGGQEIRILDEARGLLDRGHAVTLFAPPDTRIAAEAPRRGVPLIVVPIARKRPAGIFALAAAFKRLKPDVVNTHSSTDSWLSAIACKLVREPPVIVRTRHVSVPVPDNLGTRWLYRQACARVITTGEALREQLVSVNGLDPARVESIPTGVDASRYGRVSKRDARAALGLPADAPIVGIVATLRSWKGHRHLIEAFERLPQSDARLLIVGDGPQREALARQLAGSPARERVTLTGHQDDVAPWLAALDVFALPSTAHEGVPQALLQAMFARVPCVTTGAGAIGEIARDDETALVVPPGDPPVLAAAIGRLLADPALGTRLAASAHALVAPRYGRATMLDRMEAAFRRAIADASATP
ncbi:MAG: glycosyltransferase family 4 protein [Burkholderiales bacterium]